MNVLILGATYGSLLATKIAMAGHDVTLVCREPEAELVEAEGVRLGLRLKGDADLTWIDSATLPGAVRAVAPAGVRLTDHELVVLAMQEPQYGAPGVVPLLRAVGRAGLPCLSIMNMPPFPYLARIDALVGLDLAACYHDPEAWSALDPVRVTHCSPDPQASVAPGAPANHVQVGLPTNFKVAPFASDEHTALLRELERDIDAVRLDGREVPVKLRLRDSVFTPLAKWSMLIAGNYRCITSDGPRSIRDAVHADLELSRALYEWVGSVSARLGAGPDDLVSFDKYAAAAQSLQKPSSAARAVYAGVPRIERVDRLIKTIADHLGMRNDALDAIVSTVDAELRSQLRVSA